MRSLELFLCGRLRTTGLVAAGLAAAACECSLSWAELDSEADARTPSPAQREASRRQGRALLRAARIAWPDAQSLAELSNATKAPHQPIVLGAAVAAGGSGPADAAAIAAYQSVAGPASAAVRLLSLDPIEVSGLLARLADDIDDVAERAVRASRDELPFSSGPALDLLAEAHARAEVRLFAS